MSEQRHHELSEQVTLEEAGLLECVEVEADAREFGLHVREGKARLGLLVARSVEPGEGQGEPQDERPEVHLSGGSKVSANRFADMAETSGHRVMRYFRAWERAAEKGIVPHSDDLAPGEEPDIDWDRLRREWQGCFNPKAFGNDGGATGQLNLAYHLGKYGDRLLHAHKRFITFINNDIPSAGTTPGKSTREMAGRYALILESEAVALRKIEAGEIPERIEA